MTEVKDGWAAGTTYEAFMGRWSRLLAPEFVTWLRVPPAVHWLDVGCGTGALTEAICEHAHPAGVVGCDPVDSFVAFAREHSPQERASFVVAGVGSLPKRTNGYGSVTSMLALNFFPDPEAAVREMRSLAAPGGTVSSCVWDYAGRMEFLRYFWDAAVAENPETRALDEGVRFPVCRPEALEPLFENTGLRDVQCEAIDIPTGFTSFDDYWRPFMGGTGPAGAYACSLSEDRRSTLARRLESTLPRRTDGSIVLTARAWAIRGTVGPGGGA